MRKIWKLYNIFPLIDWNIEKDDGKWILFVISYKSDNEPKPKNNNNIQVFIT